MLDTIAQFIPRLFAGFLVNLEIGAAVVVIAILVGLPLAVLRAKFSAPRRLVGALVRLMQALPTYVVMFFVLTLMPRGAPIAGWIAVILAQSVYLTAYVAEDADEALRHLQRNDRERALLFLPNLLRGFVVVVMSSGFAAAVGVPEAVSTTLHAAEHLPTLSDRLLLFGVAIGFFAVVVGSLNAVIQHFIARLR